MSTAEPWTIKRLLEWTTDFLRESGSDSPRLDAEVLLAEARDCQRIQLYTCFDEVPSEEVLARFRGWIRDRAAGKPVAYLVGHREFYSLSFEVNSDVLIPRPETETLVTLAVDFLNARETSEPVAEVCEIGTGSGCVSIAIARNSSTCRITATDISLAALKVAESNCRKHDVADRIQFLQSDLFAAVDEQQRFDCIVSNPPYIGLAEKNTISAEVAQHEPHVALFAGETGLDVIRGLVEQAPHYLRPGGVLMFELSPMLAEAGRDLAAANSSLGDVQIQKDLSKQPRVVVASKK